MKKTGSTSEFTADRNRELYKNFLSLLRESTATGLRQLFSLAAKMPASRFWVSEERATIVISEILRGKTDTLSNMYPKRREMYIELVGRVRDLLARNPGVPLCHAVEQAIHQEAPEFYLTDESARLIIYRYRQAARKANALANIRHLIK